MIRDPAIHIRKSDLLRICKEEGVTFPEDFVSALLAKASKVKLTKRVMITAKAATASKIARTAVTSDNVVAQFNGIYMGTLHSHDRRTTSVHKGTRQYLVLKEVASAAHNFAQDYKMKYLTTAFKLYIEYAIAIIGLSKITLQRIKGVDYRIRDRHESVETLKWVDKKQVEAAHEAWDLSLKNFYSLCLDVNQDQLADIARASQEAKEAKASIQDWMDAQFDKWSYKDDMPEFSQLNGDNAKLAHTKYMATQGKKYINDAEKEHFKNVKDGKKIQAKGEKRQRGQDKG
ncbi:hypothetical protein LCGC14_0278680 [marine sediment metagenome]|uniref:Uncharacterized protein n=1 Tax=marine sediment metagenome TaxID=412755 RepID=A0A0F9TWY3_9ZZZZ